MNEEESIMESWKVEIIKKVEDVKNVKDLKIVRNSLDEDAQTLRKELENAKKEVREGVEYSKLSEKEVEIDNENTKALHAVWAMEAKYRELKENAWNIEAPEYVENIEASEEQKRRIKNMFSNTRQLFLNKKQEDELEPLKQIERQTGEENDKILTQMRVIEKQKFGEIEAKIQFLSYGNDLRNTYDNELTNAINKKKNELANIRDDKVTKKWKEKEEKNKVSDEEFNKLIEQAKKDGGLGYWLVGLFLLFVVLPIVFFSFVEIIPAGEVGVVYDVIDGVKDYELKEGLSFKLPWQFVERYSIRTQEYTMSIATGEGEKTGDDSIDGLTSEGLNVYFYKLKSNIVASYSYGRLDVNLNQLTNWFFKEPVSIRTTDLILHELGHHYGMHTEKEYHKAITKMGAELVDIALKEPTFFKITELN